MEYGVIPTVRYAQRHLLQRQKLNERRNSPALETKKGGSEATRLVVIRKPPYCRVGVGGSDDGDGF